MYNLPYIIPLQDFKNVSERVIYMIYDWELTWFLFLFFVQEAVLVLFHSLALQHCLFQCILQLIFYCLKEEVKVDSRWIFSRASRNSRELSQIVPKLNSCKSNFGTITGIWFTGITGLHWNSLIIPVVQKKSPWPGLRRAMSGDVTIWL